MVENRLAGKESVQRLSAGLNRIFEDYQISFGGVNVGDIKEDGGKANWRDVLECFKEDLRSGDKFGELDKVTDRGFLMLMVQASDQLPPDFRTRAINLFDEFSQF